MTAIDRAIEHCAWAKAAGMTPREVVTSCGCIPPPVCTWGVASRALARIQLVPGKILVPKAQQPRPTTRRPRADQSQARERPCMTCGKPFRSAGFANRMCDRCRKRAKWSSAAEGWEYERAGIGEDPVI